MRSPMQAAALMRRRSAPYWCQGLSSDERAELRRLRREKGRLAGECEILKATAAAIAREPDRR